MISAQLYNENFYVILVWYAGYKLSWPLINSLIPFSLHSWINYAYSPQLLYPCTVIILNFIKLLLKSFWNSAFCYSFISPCWFGFFLALIQFSKSFCWISLILDQKQPIKKPNHSFIKSFYISNKLKLIWQICWINQTKLNLL